MSRLWTRSFGAARSSIVLIFHGKCQNQRQRNRTRIQRGKFQQQSKEWSEGDGLDRQAGFRLFRFGSSLVFGRDSFQISALVSSQAVHSFVRNFFQQLV